LYNTQFGQALLAETMNKAGSRYYPEAAFLNHAEIRNLQSEIYNPKSFVMLRTAFAKGLFLSQSEILHGDCPELNRRI
ncbi:MAG: hypothetical protein QME81_20175, partial [bacterium]|nr:hypothetical protein [bacterium]